MTDADERRIPLLLLAAGVAMYVVAAFARVGPNGVAPTLLLVGIAAVVQTVLLILTAFLVAALVSGLAFGPPASAALKFAAATVCSGGVAALIGPLGGWISAAVFLGLVMWLFDLEFIYALLLTVVYWLVLFVVGMLISAIARA